MRHVRHEDKFELDAVATTENKRSSTSARLTWLRGDKSNRSVLDTRHSGATVNHANIMKVNRFNH